MSTKIVLQTPRLFLRELTPADLDVVAEMLADPEVMRFWPRPYTRDESLQWIEKQIARYARHGCGYWLAIERDSNLPVGQAGVMYAELNGVEQPHLGWIIHRPFWRRGFAFEAAQACIRFIFEHLNHDRAVALIRPQNEPSVNLAQKLGMSRVGSTIHAQLEHDIYERVRGLPI